MLEKYKHGDALDFEFIKAPKYLLGEPYNKLSNDAKMLYILMINRLSLSIANGKHAENDQYYIVYTREHEYNNNIFFLCPNSAES